MLDQIVALKSKGFNFREIGERIGLTRNQVAGRLFRAGLCRPSESLIGVPKPRFKKPREPKPRKPTKAAPQFIPANNPLFAPVVRAEYRRAYQDVVGEGMPFAEAVERNLCLFVNGDVDGTRTVACGCVRTKKTYCATHYAVCYRPKAKEGME